MAKSRGLEKDGRRERIFALGRLRAVQRFAREGPCLLGIFSPWQAGREYFVRCNWRRETNRNPTCSGLWKTILAAGAMGRSPVGEDAIASADQRGRPVGKAVVVDLLDEEIRHIGPRDESRGPVVRIDQHAVCARTRSVG